MAQLLGFPNPVDEHAARSVAGGVLLLAVTTFVLSLTVGSGWLWLSAVLAYGFVARVLAGPRLSPLGQFATRVVAPRLGPAKLVPGPPKRFAQAVGAAFTVAAVLLHFGFGADGAAEVLLACLIVAAMLESVFGLCLGCTAFGYLMKAGLVPAETCAACADIRLRAPQPI